MKKTGFSLDKRQAITLLIASFLSLYFEMLVIRWLGSEVRLFSYFKNLIMMAAFLGLGVGFALSHRKQNYWEWFIPAFLVFVPLVMAVSRSGGGNVVVPDPSEYLWKAHTLPVWISTPLFVFLILVFFSFTFILFIPAGQLVGRHMRGLPPIKAYIINLIGSLVGIWAFALVSYLRFSPWAWFMVGLLGALWFLKDSRRHLLIGSVSGLVVILILIFTQDQTLWSPYYRIEVSYLVTEEIAPYNPEDAGYWLGVNQIDHMTAVNLSSEYLNSNPKFAEMADPLVTIYNLPYLLTEPDSVLIVGAGSGNDVAAGLRNGVEKIDAVEIDPLIYEIALNHHPEQPYRSDAVTIYIDDARAYFEKAEQTYDLIVFGILDSQTLLSGMSGVRLDNYVYTQESIHSAKELLNENGMVAVTFYAERWWIVQRIGDLLEEAFGQRPIQLSIGDTNWVTFISGFDGEIEEILGFCEQNRCEVESPPEIKPIPLSTDDWPYLYNEDRGIPISYLIVLVIVVAIAWLGMRRVYPDAKQINWHFFFLGGAFLLIEFKIITELALLFGSTWLVNAIAVSMVLIMVLISNLIVDYTKKIDRKWLYILLSVTLVISYLMPMDNLLGYSVMMRALMTLLIMGLPLLFAAAIFAVSIKGLSDVTEAFASNFFGSAVGGVLEYSAMAFGIKSLYLFGAVLYLASWFTRPSD